MSTTIHNGNRHQIIKNAAERVTGTRGRWSVDTGSDVYASTLIGVATKREALKIAANVARAQRRLARRLAAAHARLQQLPTAERAALLVRCADESITLPDLLDRLDADACTAASAERSAERGQLVGLDAVAAGQPLIGDGPLYPADGPIAPYTPAERDALPFTPGQLAGLTPADAAALVGHARELLADGADLTDVDLQHLVSETAHNAANERAVGEIRRHPRGSEAERADAIDAERQRMWAAASRVADQQRAGGAR